MIALLKESNAATSEVRLSLRARGLILSESLRDSLWRSLANALNRLSHRIRAIDVCLEDINGPRGGVDIRCRINIHLRPRGHISVSSIASDAWTAIAKATTRARVLVDRRIKKGRTRRRKLLRPQLHTV
jgi:hypothetical protein